MIDRHVNIFVKRMFSRVICNRRLWNRLYSNVVGESHLVGKKEEKVVNFKHFSTGLRFLNCHQYSTYARKKIFQEYRAVVSLLHRSGLPEDHQRFLLNGGVVYASGDKNPSNRRPNSASRKDNSKGSSGGNKKPGQEEDDENKITSLLAKAFLWMLTAYMLIAIISLLFPNTNQPEVIRYVSWKEFVHHMLAKGEVEQVIVRPDADIVTIVLHDGAVIKGRKVIPKKIDFLSSRSSGREERLYFLCPFASHASF